MKKQYNELSTSQKSEALEQMIILCNDPKWIEQNRKSLLIDIEKGIIDSDFEFEIQEGELMVTIAPDEEIFEPYYINRR